MSVLTINKLTSSVGAEVVGVDPDRREIGRAHV